MGSGEGENSSSDVRERLTAAWQNHRIAEACGILMDEVLPRCLKWLLNGFVHQGVSYEDAEDCFDDAVEGLLKRDASQVDDPYNYVFTCAKNAALDLLRERKHLVCYDPDWEGREDDAAQEAEGDAGQAATRWSPDALNIVLEAALDVEITARDEQLRNIFGIALPRLAPARRRLVEVLLDLGTDITNAALADLMGRYGKKIPKIVEGSALERLQGRLVAAHELGINFDDLLVPTPEAWARKPMIPSPEEDIDPVL